MGAREGAFWDAAPALGVDVGGLYPAQADWLRWQYQRTQVDRTADAAWMRDAGAGLRKQITDADAAMVWVRLGGLVRDVMAHRPAVRRVRVFDPEHQQQNLVPRPALFQDTDTPDAVRVLAQPFRVPYVAPIESGVQRFAGFAEGFGATLRVVHLT
ncbi:hypothetical protein [Pseudorhodobacter antarcticus]|uniref:hypothetical protein n=1 Tax=Pseudorhodobacter antarcticus TaxID=1077947 RepID=UPI00067B7096|nr:hypothetical protein [Pseudorhodobacter antarcticus]